MLIDTAALLIIFAHNCDKALDLHGYHEGVGYYGGGDELEKVHIILASNTVIEPRAVVIKSLDTLVTGAAVLSVLLNLQLANLTEILTILILNKRQPLLHQILLNLYHIVLGIHLGGPYAEIDKEKESH